nr:MAG TPA: hypothetical protein [Bacteriophage sp.]
MNASLKYLERRDSILTLYDIGISMVNSFPSISSADCLSCLIKKI